MGHQEQEEEGAVRLLGERIGYGRIMQLCEQIWNEKQPGGAHSVGPCVALLVKCDHPDSDRAGHCDWCCGAGRITERVFRAQRSSAVPALRRLAVIDTHVNTQGRVIVDGHRCRVCLFSWKLHALEQHADDCPLKGSR